MLARARGGETSPSETCECRAGAPPAPPPVADGLERSDRPRERRRRRVQPQVPPGRAFSRARIRSTAPLRRRVPSSANPAVPPGRSRQRLPRYRVPSRPERLRHGPGGRGRGSTARARLALHCPPGRAHERRQRRLALRGPGSAARVHHLPRRRRRLEPLPRRRVLPRLLLLARAACPGPLPRPQPRERRPRLRHQPAQRAVHRLCRAPDRRVGEGAPQVRREVAQRVADLLPGGRRSRRGGV